MRGKANPVHNQQPSTEDIPATPSTEDLAQEVMSEEELGQRPAREVMRARTFKDSELGDIESWDQAMLMATAAYGEVANAGTVLGTGFRIATEQDKERLCGVPLLLLEWSFNDGDFGDDFVSISAIQRLDDGGISKWVINDGGTGIRKQLREYQAKSGKTGGLGVPKGLRVSKFFIDANTHETLTKQEVAEAIVSKRKIQPAHTFYLDLSA